MPKGGVSRPTISVMIMIIPKASGSIPEFTSTGRKTGAKIVIDARFSMKQPTTSKNATSSRVMT